MQKDFPNYEMPHLATVDHSTTLARLLDIITATKVSKTNLYLPKIRLGKKSLIFTY